MAKPSKRSQALKTRLEKKEERRAEAMFSAELTDFHGVSALPGQLIDAGLLNAEWWAMSDTGTLFERTRMLRTQNDFVGSWMQIRRICFDDDFRFGGQNKALQAWLDGRGKRVLSWVSKINSDIWEEFLLNDNVVVFWMETSGGKLPRVKVLDCEICDYKSSFGGDVLKIKLPKKKLSDEEKQQLPDRWVEKYEKGGWIEVKEEDGERFKVLTRGKSGTGFCVPRLRQVIPMLMTRYNLHKADWAGSDQHNNVIQQVKVGREIRFADAMQYLNQFGITKAIKEQLEKELKTKRGSFRAITDISIDFLWKYLDPKFFDADKYKGTQTMLDRWGGAGMMLLAEGSPWLVPFFRQEGMFDRALVAGFLNDLLEDRDFLPMKPPAPLRVEWNPTTFEDIKMLLERLRFSTGSGLMSWETARSELRLDNATETERLKSEGADRAGCEPPFEPKQGMLTDGAANGRPAEGPGGTRKGDT